MKEKAPSGSGSARKSLGPAFEESEGSLSGIMAQMLELLQKLNEKVGNNITSLLLLDKKIDNMAT